MSDHRHERSRSSHDDHRHKPDLKRKHSAADDDRVDRHKHRKSENGSSSSNHEQDQMLRVIFRPMKDAFRRVGGATKEKIKSQKERANLLKNELLTIGNFIDSLEADEDVSALRPSFWLVLSTHCISIRMLTFYRTYVAAQWPLDPKPQGRALEDMHRKILAAAKARAASSDTSGSKPNPSSTKVEPVSSKPVIT